MPMSQINLETAAGWAGAGTVFATLVGLVVRFLMKTFRTDRLEAASSTAEISTYQKLQGEISRLETIIIGQQKKLEEMETRLNKLRDIELEDVSDIAMLTVLVAQLPCGSCNAPDAVFQQTQEILAKMHHRKRESQGIIRGTI